MKGKELCPLLHLYVVAIEKEIFGLPSTKIVQFILCFVHVYKEVLEA